MRLFKKLTIFMALMVLVTSVVAKDVNKKKAIKAKSGGDAKELSGISIVGNKEAPKSLFIVPWKTSEIGVETGLASSLLNEKLQPVDKEVFNRELGYYEITVGDKP